MRHRSYSLEGLLELDQHRDTEARRGLFRQSIASLASTPVGNGPGPLEGCDQAALVASVRLALADGLFDDLGWLAKGAAGLALYEITSALPLGTERREVSRRVRACLFEADATTFATIATRVAALSPRGLTGIGLHARVALTLTLPTRADVPVGPLAIALASRRDAAELWIAGGSTRSLPERRLSARLIEHAAKEVAHRAAQGDEQALFLFASVFATDLFDSRRAAKSANSIASAWQTLLADREGLVWRHVAVARGLLWAALPSAREETESLLDPSLTPTEWRRGATSLAAALAVSPRDVLPRCLALLESPLLRRDPGIASSMMWGLGPAADTEPEAAEKLLNALAALNPLAIAESLIELRADVGDFGRKALETCVTALSQSLLAPEADDGLSALARSILHDLSASEGGGGELRNAIVHALDAFAENGSARALELARRALEIARESVAALETLDVGDGDTSEARLGRRTSVALLRDLDTSLYEWGALKDLLLLDQQAGEELLLPLEDLDERLVKWLVRVEQGGVSDAPTIHATLHQRQLRSLLHIVDAEAFEGEIHERRVRARQRWLTTSKAMLNRLLSERGSPLRRAVAATLARGYDALVRDGVTDASDVAVNALARIPNHGDLEILAEASTLSDTRKLLSACAAFQLTMRNAVDADVGLSALRKLVDAIPAGASQRTEVLRGTLARLGRGLNTVRASKSLIPLIAENAQGATSLDALEDELTMLAQVTAGAAQRCGDADERSARRRAHGNLTLTGAVQHIVQHQADDTSELDAYVDLLIERARTEIPPSMAELVAQILPRISTLPVDRPSIAVSMIPTADAPLPAWIPARRTLGGFYVQRALGGGALGSVFVVTRTEERHNSRAERFALKVPEYNATSAMSVSEAEFLRLFREEAGALLAIPEHPNVARFVTFDAGAKPKPILVMELIEGPTCERVLASNRLTMSGTIRVLDGILSGLEAMHARSVGHLDLKPTNVILRGSRDPVLVDFGLAGRHIRSGCATGSYGAPEVWGALPPSAGGTPLTADIYSFGCLAYEMLTTQTLFHGQSDVAVISAHLTHDGEPPGVQKLARDPDLKPLVAFLKNCLRHKPTDRHGATELRGELALLGTDLASKPWPLLNESDAA